MMNRLKVCLDLTFVGACGTGDRQKHAIGVGSRSIPVESLRTECEHVRAKVFDWREGDLRYEQPATEGRSRWPERNLLDIPSQHPALRFQSCSSIL